jgi:hypothetical protein
MHQDHQGAVPWADGSAVQPHVPHFHVEVLDSLELHGANLSSPAALTNPRGPSFLFSDMRTPRRSRHRIHPPREEAKGVPAAIFEALATAR